VSGTWILGMETDQTFLIMVISTSVSIKTDILMGLASISGRTGQHTLVTLKRD
jgi:hypothetical protein